ncbi:hypothetical protein [Halorubrum sp. FL23]|uniref:hypothetical protein n=1 Tax=Halorubrum sp. FL23 TaxID=3458704 RepID=UPI004034D11C
MDEGLVVRLLGVSATLIILLVAITVGALLGDNPDEMFMWSVVGVVLLSIGALVAVHHFEDRINALG